MVKIENNELPEKKRTPNDSLTDNNRAEGGLRDAIGEPETRVAFGGESWLPPVPTAPRTNPLPVPSNPNQPSLGKMEGPSGQPPEEVRKPEPPANTPKENNPTPPEASSEGRDNARAQPTGEKVPRDGSGKTKPAPQPPKEDPLKTTSPLSQKLKETRQEGERRIAEEQAQVAQPVLGENNRGMEAWHDTMRERNALTASERRMGAGNQVNNKIDGLRNGVFPDGTPRQFPPEDAPVAVEAKEKALETTERTAPAPRTPRDESP